MEMNKQAYQCPYYIYSLMTLYYEDIILGLFKVQDFFMKDEEDCFIENKFIKRCDNHLYLKCQQILRYIQKKNFISWPP